MHLKWPGPPDSRPIAKGSSPQIPRMPLNSVLLLMVPSPFPPKRRIVPELVEPMLTFPVIEDIDVNARTILSGVPPTSSLFEMARFDCVATNSMEVLTWPLDLLLSIVALQRPKLV